MPVNFRRKARSGRSGRFRPTDRAPTELYRKANGGPGRGVFWTSILNSLKGPQNPKNKQMITRCIIILALRNGPFFLACGRTAVLRTTGTSTALTPTEILGSVGNPGRQTSVGR